MWLEGLALEFRGELAAEGGRVVGGLYDLDVGFIRRGAGDLQSRTGEQRFVLAIQFVTVAMALADLGLAIGLGGVRVGIELAVPGTESHGAAEFFYAAQFAKLVNDAVRRGRIEFAGVGFG